MESADEPVQSDSVFRLLNQFGDDASPGERGLLLYKGGTVCYRLFGGYSAGAICREMGYTKALNWTKGYLHDHDYQERLEINLGNVWCDSDDWKSCTYATDPGCDHDEEVL